MVDYMKVPIRYLPNKLTSSDKKKQIIGLQKSKRLYKQHKYFTRNKVASFVSKPSSHVSDARRIYNIENVSPSQELANKTGCSLSALNKIVEKGEGAYYSSGSRPNQTSQSWGLARLASSITAGKSAAVDYNILEKGCNHTKRAFRLANKARQKYKYGHSKTKKTNI